MFGTPKYVKGEKAWKELEELGIIERVGPNEPTTWTSALHFAVKADGSLRPCGDYRALNDRTEADVYPLPSLRSFSTKLRGCKWFSKVDLVKSYHQIPLDPISSQKTTLCTPFGQFRFRRLTMGLKNSGPSFQKMMDYVLRGVPNLYVYMDDILVFTKTEQEHKKNTEH